MQQLLDKRCVRVMTDSETGFFSRVFLVPKRSGGWRLVIDLSVSKRLSSAKNIRNGHAGKGKEALRPGMWATSLDLSDAYHHIPMRQSARKFLCVQVGQVHMYMVLPFGLTTAPSGAFTEVVKQIKKVGESAPVCALPIPRRLAQRSREQRDADPHDTCPVVTVSSTRLASKRGQVRTDPVTVNSVSRESWIWSRAQPSRRERDPHDHQQDPARRRSVVRWKRSRYWDL